MSITLRQLEIFIAVAETAQVTKASRKLYVTQSAVSMALAELENQLGGSLFDRRGRSLLLNARGRFLLPHAKNVTAQVTNIETIMSETNDRLTGTITVVASTTLGNYILPYLIGAFQRVHPNVRINLMVCNTPKAEKRVFEKKAEIGFVEGPLSDNSEIEWEKWFEDELVVLCGPSDPLAHNQVFDVTRDIKGKKWIMREKGSGTYASICQRFGKYMDEIDVVMEMGHPEAVKRGVESGVGITCLSSLSMCREVEHGWLKSLKIKGLDTKRQLKIVRRKDLDTGEALKEFLVFCDVMKIDEDNMGYLSSPWKLQSLLARHSALKK
ncbi:MAG: LysR family transcriptional regulator [Deltaproteobacteria bacterium]|nr:MAG: LysR family transcriptional regulator [Deltaproteobacteria bacterium]